MNHLVIDASNIISGGGLTHLKELLKHAKPYRYNFNKITVWAPDKTLEKLHDKKWLNKESHSFLNKGYLHRFLWKKFIFKSSLEKGTIVFIPGTGYISGGRKVVTMCQNLLPLELEEIKRYFFSKGWIRAYLLRILHLRVYKKVDAVIFLNKYCKRLTSHLLKNELKNSSIIPHGLSKDFFFERKDFKYEDTFKLLYVSSLDLYKHQWIIAEAVALLNNEGHDITLNLIGRSYNGAKNKLRDKIVEYPILRDKLNWDGTVPYEDLSDHYKNNDAFIYGSTCETFGMTLLEAMASSLPIACSDKSSMHEMLKDAGIYYDPLSVSDCQKAIIKLITNERLRKELGTKAHLLAKNYSWEKCSDQTLNLLEKVAS